MNEEAIFTAAEMVKISGAKYRNVIYWGTAKLFDKEMIGKKWRRNMWTLDEIFEVRIIHLLRRWEFLHVDIRKVVQEFRKTRRFLFIAIDENDRKILFWDKEDQRKRAFQEESIFCINISRVWRRVRSMSVELLAKRMRIGAERFLEGIDDAK